MSDCVFCKISQGEIPSRKVYEDDQVFAIMDLTQVTPGHTLLIPKKHVRNILEFDEEFATTVFSRLPKVAKAIYNSNDQIKGLNILMNNEPLALQTVFHSHIHLIPRYTSDDGLVLQFEDSSDKYSDEELDEIKDRIIKTMEE